MNQAVIHEKQALPLNLSGRIPELDGIRGIAIGMVLIAHHFEVVSRLSWVYFEKPLVKMGHRTSYQFGAPRLARTAPTPAEGS